VTPLPSPETPPVPRTAPPAAGIDARAAAAAFHMGACPTRLAVLGVIAARGPAAVGVVVAAVGQTQAAVSHHLSLLRAAGLVDYERKGKQNVYRLLPAGESLVRHAREAFPAKPGK
jgi:DNA-binding transcriptional ArsR family regulator